MTPHRHLDQHDSWRLFSKEKEDATRVAIGSDHAGYPLKDYLTRVMAGEHHFVDLGTHSTDSVDYPDFAAAVGEAVRTGEVKRGIIVCGSGAGV